jgi:hypothetical protein
MTKDKSRLFFHFKNTHRRYEEYYSENLFLFLTGYNQIITDRLVVVVVVPSAERHE